MPTKSVNDSVLLYIKGTINYKLRPDLNVEKQKQLESIFIEIIQKTSTYIVIGCIYRHPVCILYEFNDLFLKSLTERLAKENEGQGSGIIYDVMVDLHKVADAIFAITQKLLHITSSNLVR